MISTGGHQSVKLTLMLRFRRNPDQPTHVETFWRFGKRSDVALCGKDMTGARTMAAYPVGSEKAREFWTTVCKACGQAMDRLS